MTVNMYEVVDFIARVLFFGAQAFYLDKLYSSVLKRKPRYMAIVPAGYILIMIVLKYNVVLLDNVIIAMIGTTVSFFLSYLIYRGGVYLRVYVAVTFLSVKYPVYVLSVVGNSFMTPFFLWIDLILYGKGMQEQSIWYTLSSACFAVCTVLFQSLLFMLVMKGVLHRGRGSEQEYTPSEVGFMLAPDAVGILWGMLINRIYLQMEKERLMVYRQLQDMQLHINRVEQLYESIKGVKHDIRKHLSHLWGLMEQGNTEQMYEYFKQFDLSMSRLEFPFQTGNPVTDIIIGEFAEASLLEGIEFEAAFFFPSETDLEAFDISIVLQNALQNGLEACSSLNTGKKFLRVQSRQRKNAYILQLENSCPKELKLDAWQLPKTTKADKELHGMGLKNIGRVAGKYHGAMELKCGEGIFTLTVMLMCCGK